MADLPFRAEYAKSARSSCKGCREKIEKDHLRLAVMVQSPMFDGKMPSWYHFSCFFVKQRPKSVGDISHFESLRWEDQEKIRAKVESGAAGSSVASPAEGKKSAKRKQSKKGNEFADYCVQYSISSRATCRGCEVIITKGEVRVSKKDFDSEEGRRYGGMDRWYHLECFVKCRAELEFWAAGSKLPGYKTLKQEDQEKVVSLLLEIPPIKKEENGEEVEKKPKLDDSGILKRQNKLLYEYRDALKALHRNDLILLLEHNHQQIPSGPDNMLDRLADAMAFGVLLPCPHCKNGQVVFRSGVGYFCLGHKDEWTRCESVIDDPEKKKLKIPKELKDKYEFLKNYKYKPRKRVFEKNQPSEPVTSAVYQNISKSTKSESTSGPKVERSLPLKNMELVIDVRSQQEKSNLKLAVLKLGGRVTHKISSSTTAVIATQDKVDKKSSCVNQAEQLEVQVVPVTFIDECKKGGSAIQLINSMNLVEWGSDPTSRMSTDVVDSKSKSKSSKFKSNMPSKMKLKVKDGVAVDPGSNLQDVAHVYRRGDEIFDAALSLTDLQSGRNSFYKLQVLESDLKHTYWLFRSWGRIGTTIGGKKLESLSREAAITQFKYYFEDKTANMWDNRQSFIKIPGKMTMMDICYEDENDGSSKLDETIPSKLAKPIQQLVSLIFNVNSMKSVMKEMELDLEKMPLGKLSKKQIQQAYQVLTDAQNEIRRADGDVDLTTIVGLTNKFFTLIPHDFDTDNPPLLNNLELIKQKVDMLDTLIDIEIAYSMLKDHTGEDAKVNRLDVHYLKLNADIQILDRLSTEFELVKLYVKNTHAETHRNYTLEVVEVFKVSRNGEDKRFKPFKKLHNRKLLWHGSRLTNFAGIISQGLRIAPPEAPVTGYMFGKGVYFADMVSKSANYCMTNPNNNTGLLLLCEVALGDSHELYHAENIVKPPAGKHSVKGLGKTHPDPAASVMTEDGVEIPLGKGMPSEHKNTSLLYNEFIVYDVAQVKVRYLVQLKFNYAY